MSIENSLERITIALEELAHTQAGLLEVAKWHKERAARRDGEISEEQPRADHAPDRPPVNLCAAPREAHQWTYDELKAELQRRGVSVAKGTKMTTLLKFWELHKNDPEMQVAEAPAQLNDACKAPAEEPAASPVPDPLARVPQAEAPKKPMTAAECREYLMKVKGYTGTPAQIAAMKRAIEKLGKSSFGELVEGDYEKLIEAFEELMTPPDAVSYAKAEEK